MRQSQSSSTKDKTCWLILSTFVIDTFSACATIAFGFEGKEASKLRSFLRVFFGNILSVIGWILIIAGIIALFFAGVVVGIVIIVIGIALISVSTVMHRW